MKKCRQAGDEVFMKKMFLLFCMVAVLAGCSTLGEVPANIAGVSIRNLEKARVDSIYQVYPCDLSACFSAVLEVAEKNQYYIFSKNEDKGVIVLMNVPGYVDTTEVGVFFSPELKGQGVRVELSSRSTPVKRDVAKVLFSELNVLFNKK